jgi:hypothetical protein
MEKKEKEGVAREKLGGVSGFPHRPKYQEIGQKEKEGL